MAAEETVLCNCELKSSPMSEELGRKTNRTEEVTVMDGGGVLGIESGTGAGVGQGELRSWMRDVASASRRGAVGGWGVWEGGGVDVGTW